MSEDLDRLIELFGSGKDSEPAPKEPPTHVPAGKTICPRLLDLKSRHMPCSMCGGKNWVDPLRAAIYRARGGDPPTSRRGYA